MAEKTADDIIKQIKDEDVQYVDIRFCDLPGVVQHFSVPASVFDAAIVRVPAAEKYASNLVAIGAHAVVAEGFPRTHDALDRAGFTLHPVPVSEARKADGSLTCQSILL